jgi:hypothetical protein
MGQAARLKKGSGLVIPSAKLLQRCAMLNMPPLYTLILKRYTPWISGYFTHHTWSKRGVRYMEFASSNACSYNERVIEGLAVFEQV